MQKRTYLF